MGAMMDAIFNARGRVKGRFGFFIDEAVLIGAERSLKTIRDQGRKYKAIAVLYYQSEGQIEDIWARTGKAAWFDALAWRSYSVIANSDTAKDVSLTLGTFTAAAESEGWNQGTSARFMELANHQKGGNKQRTEMKRELAMVHELLQMHPTERITIVRSNAPIRHAAAIALTRPELEGRLDVTDFQRGDFDDDEMEDAA
jgi:type IV secretory pathway TraG/TraD family ATPase VirD4